MLFRYGGLLYEYAETDTKDLARLFLFAKVAHAESLCSIYAGVWAYEVLGNEPLRGQEQKPEESGLGVSELETFGA